MFRLHSYLLIVLAGLIWGSSFTLTMIAASGGMTPFVLACMHSGTSSIVFMLICRFSGLPILHRGNLRYYCVIATLGIVAPNVLYYTAAPYLSAGILSITVSTVPMLTYLVAWVIRLEPFIAKRMVGILFGMFAILLLILPGSNLSKADASLWLFGPLLCAACYAVENVYISEGVNPVVDVRELLCGSNIVATGMIFPLVLGMGEVPRLQWFFSGEFLAVIGIGFSSALAYLLYFSSIKKAGPVFASQCAYIVTISGVIWGMVLLAERHSAWVYFSVGIMMAGLALVSPRAAVKESLPD